MMKLKILYISAFVVMLSSCAVKPYSSPTPQGQGVTSYRGVSGDTTNIASVSWASYYDDIYLQRYIGEALDSNLNLRVAINQIEAARAYFKQSKAALAPMLNAGATATFSNPSDVGTMEVPKGYIGQLYNLSVGAKWEVDIWGKLSSAKRAAQARLFAEESSRDVVVTQLISDMASAYYQLLSLDYKLKITRETVGNYQKYLETVKAMKESAATNEIAVQQATAQLYGAQSYIPQIESSITVLENYICFLMGRPGMNVERSSLEELTVPSMASLSVGVPAQLLQYRPDVRKAESMLRASHEQFNVARASMYPALVLNGSVGSESLGISNWFAMPSSLFWSAVAGLSQPLFAGRQLRTAKEVAALQNSDALLGFRSYLLNAAQEVSAAYLRSQSTAESFKMQTVQVDALRKASEYSEELMLRGYATYLDVLVAQNALFSTELKLCDSYLSVVEQRIELYRALGGGWNR